MQVVQGVEPRACNLVGALQMMQVGQGKILAGVATTARIEWAGVIAVFGVTDLDVAEPGK